MPFLLSHFGWVKDPARPVHSELCRLAVDKLNAAEVAIARASSGGSTKTIALEEMRVARTLFEESVVLRDWVTSIRQPMSLDQAMDYAGQLRQAGFRPDIITNSFTTAQSRDVGAPRKIEPELIVSAFELMLQARTWSIGKVTRKLCRCGSEKHGAECEQRFKAGIRNLKKVLRQYVPKFVTRYDVLHPDRNKKVNG